MASPPQLEPFERARKEVWGNLTAKEKNELAGTCTIEDVWKVAEDIQKNQAEKRGLGNMNKIRPYLDGLRSYDDVIKVLISSNPGILALIWGPIKFLLQVASNYFHGYDKLLDAFREIGSSLPQFKDIAQVFRGSDQIANYLGLFYAEIIEFHYQAMRFFRQTSWKMFFECLWPKYEDIFAVVGKNIERHKCLIDREIKIQMIKESRKEGDEALKRHQEERDEATKRHREERDEDLKRHRKERDEALKRHREERDEALKVHQEVRDSKELDRLERNIPPHDYRPLLEKVQRAHCTETGKWVFSDPLFRSWLGAKSDEAKQRLLWLAGVPGAGKTFLCFSILQYLQEMAQANESIYILYAFLTYDDIGGNTEAAVIRSLLYQLCRANQSLIPVANKEHDCRQSRSLLLNTWGKLLEKFICGSQPVYIILDGLDECDEMERGHLLRTILSLWQNCSNLHVLVASRKEVDIRRVLKPKCESLIVEEKNRTDIERFVTKGIEDLWAEIRHSAEPRDGEFFKTVARSIVNQCEGMFLFARLMIAHLNAQPTVPQIISEASNLPCDLNEIYSRMLRRISTALSPHEQATVKRIFCWLICTRRPLRTVELEHALLIQSGDNEIQHRRALRKGVLQLCGPIVEVRKEYITFIHFSAKEYLTKDSTDCSYSGIRKAESHAEVAITCLSYLSFRYFDANITDDEVDGFIVRGGYVLHQYSQLNFLHHIRGAWCDEGGASETLKASTREFLKARWNPSFRHIGSEPPPPSSSTLERIRSMDPEGYKMLSILGAQPRARNPTGGTNGLLPLCTRSLGRPLSVFREYAHWNIFTNADIGNEPLLLTAISHRIAKRFDLLASGLCSGKGHDICAPLHIHYGAGLFFCPIPSCSRHGHGFETRDKRETHTAKHLRPVKCGVVDCDFSFIGFESEADKAAHVSICHNLAQQVEMTWEDMDGKSCFRVLCSAAREREFGLVQSLLSLISDKIIDLGGFGKLLLAAGEGQSADIINLVISVCQSGRGTRYRLKLNNQLEEALRSATLSGSEELVRGLFHSKLLVDLDISRTNALTHRGRAPLHLAVLGQSESIVELLLDNGASVGVQSRKDSSTALHLAATGGHEAIARLLLDHGADIEARDVHGWTALLLAARDGHEATAQLLLGRGANIETNSGDGQTALHLTAEGGHEATARLLLDRGADIEAKGARDLTGLHLAAMSGHEATAQLLLDRGADIETNSGDGQTALHLAAKGGHEATARLLLDRGADIEAKDPHGLTGLHLAAMSGREATAQLLLDRGAGIEAKGGRGRTALRCAATGGHEAITELLLDYRADIEAESAVGWTGLHYAANRGHEATARLLLDRGADTEANDAYDQTGLHLAAHHGHEAVARLLLDHGADIEAKDVHGWTALLFAARGGHETTAQLLLGRGADIETNSGDGQTALHLAAKGGHEATARLLLDRGADIEAKDVGGLTALHFVAYRGLEAAARFLLDRGASIEAKDVGGRTGLHFAAKSGHEATARLLLDRGADIEAKDAHGLAALHLASMSGNEATAQLLLDRGAGIEVKDADGRTGLHFAAIRGHKATAQLLLDRGADAKAKDVDGRTVLDLAVDRGHGFGATAQLLFDRGAHNL